jgi:DNA polymerase V
MHDVVLVPVPETVLPAYLPVFACLVPADFPSPADDHVEALFDLNQLLFRHPDATYLVRVTGESMAGAKIHAGDLLAVDKHLKADHGHIVVAVVKGDCTVKRLERRGANWWLVPVTPPSSPTASIRMRKSTSGASSRTWCTNSYRGSSMPYCLAAISLCSA